MATIKIRWTVEELVNVMSLYDTQKVYRSTTVEEGPYTEITDAGTRVLLVAGESSYYFDDLVGDPDYWYSIAYYNSSTLEEGSKSAPIQGSGGGYVSLADVRAAGVAETTADDATVIAAIDRWQQFIDKACGQWFERRPLDFTIDGTGCSILWFKVPIISVSAVYMNSDFVNAVESGAFVVYNNLGEGLVDDRKNPKIAITEGVSADFFRRISSGGVFVEGRANQRVVGDFGFIEPDGTTPALIKRAVLKLVVRELASGGATPTPGPSGLVTSETTDGHTIRYSPASAAHRSVSSGITGDPEIEGIIQFYKAPKAMNVVA